MQGGDITVDVAAALVGTQFPEWSDLPLAPVSQPGWDNVTFRLGDELLVRLPSDDAYAPQVAKEHQWLPVLAPLLPFQIPEPVALAARGDSFQRKWSIYRWIEGESAATAAVRDQVRLAEDLARFLNALRGVDATMGPPAGSHSFHRGGELATYDTQTRTAIEFLSNGSTASKLVEVWETALAQAWTGAPVWVHGDVAPSNVLVVDGALSAVIDFGCCAVGDPACDLVMTWTYFSGEAREAFRHEIGLDSATWARARGWALWKALITLVDERTARQPEGAAAARFGWRHSAREIIDLVAADHGTGRLG